MRYIISESQHKIILNEISGEAMRKVAKAWFKMQISQGKDPHITDDLIAFVGITPWGYRFVELLETLRHFLKDSLLQVVKNKVERTYDTNDYPEISGGYDFKFNVIIKEFEADRLIINADIIPGGKVTLIMTNGETMDLIQAVWDNFIGDEIYIEVVDIINDILEKEKIVYYTGYLISLNKINF